MELAIQNLIKHIERKENLSGEEQKERIKKILKEIKYEWGETQCPEEAYQLIMEEEIKNGAKIKTEGKTKKSCCGEEKRGSSRDSNNHKGEMGKIYKRQ